jgi:hypothetical protein
MASQAQLELQIEQLNARLAVLRAEYEFADQEENIIYQKALQNDIKTLQSELAAAQLELANYTTVPNLDSVTITTDREPPRTFDPAADPNTNIGADTPRAEIQAVNTGGTPAPTVRAQDQATKQASTNFKQTSDWRVKLSLGPGADYLYKVPAGEAGILNPLQDTGGVIFPYTPSIQINYGANYESPDVAQTNYKIYQYKNSSVDNIQITCDFTAQDTTEAEYLMAVIHFLRSVTKMFYGQDQLPRNGTPPPLCYLSGLGAFQFDNHPLVITNFTYTLPNDVDYIRAGSSLQSAGVNLSSYQFKVNTSVLSNVRRNSAGLAPGGGVKEPQFQNLSNTKATYVPTKMQISISCLPIVTRYDISQRFSLNKYGTGELLNAKYPYGGIW